MAYLLDTNVFIQAKNLHYGFDFCPAFWEWIDAAVADGTVLSIDKVGDELTGGQDDLATWAHQRMGSLFVGADPQTVASLQSLSAWANGAAFDPAAVSTFLQVADYYLVAQAHAHGHTVVTHEVIDNSKKRIKIPSACLALNVRCVNPFQMLRAEQVRFVLGS